MSALTQEQIAQEFERQVRLCAGIGQREMIRIICDYWAKQPHEHEPFIRGKGTNDRNICMVCGDAVRFDGSHWVPRPVAVPPNSVCNDVEPLDSAGGIRS